MHHPLHIMPGHPGPALGRPECKLVPGIPIPGALRCHENRDGRDIGEPTGPREVARPDDGLRDAVLRQAMPGHDEF